MIKSFRHKGLRLLFANGDARKIQAKHGPQLRLILSMLNAATTIRQMDAPGLRLHMLKGNKAGRWAVVVDENFRVTFRFDAGDVYEVDYGDYH